MAHWYNYTLLFQTGAHVDGYSAIPSNEQLLQCAADCPQLALDAMNLLRTKHFCEHYTNLQEERDIVLENSISGLVDDCLFHQHGPDEQCPRKYSSSNSLKNQEQK